MPTKKDTDRIKPPSKSSPHKPCAKKKLKGSTKVEGAKLMVVV